MTTTTQNSEQRLAAILDRWAQDPEFEIVHAYDVLPSTSGQPHIVDPDPDARYDSYPVSLCGTVLVAHDGKVDDGTELCETCMEIYREREAER